MLRAWALLTLRSPMTKKYFYSTTVAIKSLTKKQLNRPTKRARSDSFRTTPTDHNPSKITRWKESPLKPGQRDNRVGSTVLKSNSPPTNGVRKKALLTHDIKKKSPIISNGISNLSLQPSPIRQISSAKASPLVIVDLDTESDKDVSRNKQRKAGSPPKVRSPSPQVASLSLSDWIKPEVKSIRFDPSIKSSRQSDVSRTAVSTHTAKKAKDQVSSSQSLFRNLPQATKNSSSLLKYQRLPGSSQTPKVPSVIVPPTGAQVLRRIKDDITYIRTNPKEVELGVGVARFDDTDLNAAAFDRAKQKRRKGPIKRESLLLDLDPRAPSKSVQDPSEIEQPRSAVRLILQERFHRRHDVPLKFRNRIDERCLDGKFQFVSKYIWSRGVTKRKQTELPYRACRCGETDSCRNACDCAIVQAKKPGKDLKVVHGVQPYEQNAQGITVLSQSFLALSLQQNPVIYECTDKCSCGFLCTNKVVQYGRTLPFEIFETGRCGFGVKAMQNIAKGQFIDMYLGEVLTTSEVQKRENAVEEDTPSYIMSLDMFISEEKAHFHIDGANFGSLTRFVNHSCDPNAKTIPVVLSGDTRHIYHVAFFAVKDISRGSEITIDYNPDLKDQPLDDVQAGDEALDSAIVQCKCGSAKCRKRLWMPGKDRRVRRRYLHNVDDD